MAFAIWFTLMLSYAMAQGSTRFYDFNVQTTRVSKLCKSNDIVTVNGMYPGPVLYAHEDDRVIVKVTNESPYNITIHWHGVRQRMSCWYDGPAYITQCPIQPGQTFTYDFALVGQKGTLLWHAHSSWLRGTLYGAMVIYPRPGVPYPFLLPYEEHIIILGEYWLKDLVQLELDVLYSGGSPPPADALTINGHPGPNYNCSSCSKNYNCSSNDTYTINVIPGKTYLLRIINAALNMETFFTIANHSLTIVEADGEYTKPLTLTQLMLGPGQTINVLVTADQKLAKYSISTGPYMSAKNVSFQHTPSVAYFQYVGKSPDAITLPAFLPKFNDSEVVSLVMGGLRSLNSVPVPKEIDLNLFITVGLNVQRCNSSRPRESCRGMNGGVMAASMNNISFVNPEISILEAYYRKINSQYTEDFPDIPIKLYDFVNGAPNDIPKDTQALRGTKAKVIEYGTRVQMVLQDTGTVTTENHPIHLHGYSFYVVGYGLGNYDPKNVSLNLVDPPFLNTVGVPAGGWAVVRFVADNPGVWLMHCHLGVHLSWGLSVVLIVKDGHGPLQSLPPPPLDLPTC